MVFREGLHIEASRIMVGTLHSNLCRLNIVKWCIIPHRVMSENVALLVRLPFAIWMMSMEATSSSWPENRRVYFPILTSGICSCHDLMKQEPLWTMGKCTTYNLWLALLAGSVAIVFSHSLSVDKASTKWAMRLLNIWFIPCEEIQDSCASVNALFDSCFIYLLFRSKISLWQNLNAPRSNCFSQIYEMFHRGTVLIRNKNPWTFQLLQPQNGNSPKLHTTWFVFRWTLTFCWRNSAKQRAIKYLATAR